VRPPGNKPWSQSAASPEATYSSAIGKFANFNSETMPELD
jgi:hypothetical protein